MRLLFWLVSLVLLNSPAQDFRLQKEIALGEKLSGDFQQNTTRVQSAFVQEYVDRIGQRLAAQMSDRGTSYRFEAIADDRGGYAHEPVAFPDGYIFVPAPLILAAQNEAEFACMVAHAIAVSKWHNRPSGPPSGFGLERAEIWINSESGSLAAVAEQQADADAIKIASSAGFDPTALRSYIARVNESEARLAALEQSIQRLPARSYTETGDFARVQEELRPASPQRTRRPPSLLQK